MAKDTTHSLALPEPHTRDGAARLVGVEVELGGLGETRIADIAQEHLGGTARKDGPATMVLEDTELGGFKIYLDTKYRDRLSSDFGEMATKAARAVVPVEIVSDPIKPEQIADLDRVMVALREAGAEGTGANVVNGYGVHFNPEVTSETFEDIYPVLLAYALIEDTLRDEAEIDLSRRALPFVDPYPRQLVDRLVLGGLHDLPDLIDLYLAEAPSRNYGLDMLCLFTHLDAERVKKVMETDSIGARPTYHFRLPDCRIDNPDWSLALEWKRWQRVEALSQDHEALSELSQAWQTHRSALTTIRPDWAETARHILEKRGL